MMAAPETSSHASTTYGIVQAESVGQQEVTHPPPLVDVLGDNRAAQNRADIERGDSDKRDQCGS